MELAFGARFVVVTFFGSGVERVIGCIHRLRLGSAFPTLRNAFSYNDS